MKKKKKNHLKMSVKIAESKWISFVPEKDLNIFLKKKTFRNLVARF